MTVGKPVLWITRKPAESTLERVSRDYEVIINDAAETCSGDDIVKMSSSVDAIIARHSEQFSSAVVERMSDTL